MTALERAAREVIAACYRVQDWEGTWLGAALDNLVAALALPASPPAEAIEGAVLALEKIAHGEVCGFGATEAADALAALKAAGWGEVE